ncbi:hypothetical protein E2562_021370 [Oryza meyeriana var. granulata]|uniref:Uncharacterized protein n=1 Tax=Oryza meyeriana var. granulata TaxID=110450 RepID=A0A6G1CHK3_9ORYZ|nr:hypothetical protein E2562_021370 [Oryza meyeriana var. granulata]
MAEDVESPRLSLGGDELESQGFGRDSSSGRADGGEGAENGAGGFRAAVTTTVAAAMPASTAPAPDPTAPPLARVPSGAAVREARTRAHHRIPTTAVAPPRAPSMLHKMELGGMTLVQILQAA